MIAGPDDAPYGVLVRSGDNAVSAFDLARGLEAGLAGVRLPDTEDACGLHAANPWSAAPLGAIASPSPPTAKRGPTSST